MKDTAPTLSVMHEMTRYVHASQEQIFELIADVSSWPAWQPSIRIHTPVTQLDEGTVFRWTDGGLSIRSRVAHINAPRAISWESRFLWFRSDVRWTMESDGQGTLISYEMALKGFGAMMLRPMLTNAMANTLAELAKVLQQVPQLSYS